MTISRSGPHKTSVALIGLRGSGKSSVAAELAALTGVDRVDTDETVAREAGRSIAAIFADEGEKGFRQREREAIARVVKAAPRVISVGGGAVIDEHNVRLLRQVAAVVWLTAPPDVLWERVSNDPTTTDTRPALTSRRGADEIEQVLSERSAHYEQAADHTVDTVGRSPREIALAIAAQLGLSVVD